MDRVAQPRVEPGFLAGTNVLHLTRTMLGTTAICGAYVDTIGVPENGEACPECDRLSTEIGAEALVNSIWVKASSLPQNPSKSAR